MSVSKFSSLLISSALVLSPDLHPPSSDLPLSSSADFACDFNPTLTEFSNAVEEHLIFLWCPFTLADAGIERLTPSCLTLNPRPSSRKHSCNDSPWNALCVVFIVIRIVLRWRLWRMFSLPFLNGGNEDTILLRLPFTLVDRGVERSLPAG